MSSTVSDLALTHTFEADEWSGRDLQVVLRSAGGISAKSGVARDILTLSGRENLAQAVIMRLLTPLGALAALGHAAYGSRLHELIGRQHDAALRHLLRLYVLETIAQERRVAEVVALDLTEPAALPPDRIGFTLSVRPADGLDPLTISLEFDL